MHKELKTETNQTYLHPYFIMLPKELLFISNIFLPISLNMCFGCSKEPSHRDSSFEYPQHMFWLRLRKIFFQLHTLSGGLSYCSYCWTRDVVDCLPVSTGCL